LNTNYRGKTQLKEEKPSFADHQIRLLVTAVKKALIVNKHRPQGHKRLYASSMAYKTILGLVPALAIAMAILSGPAFVEKRQAILDKLVDLIYPVENLDNDPTLDNQEKANMQSLNQAGKQEIMNSMNKFASHARGVGFIGLASFALVVFLLLRDVENAFNYLWGIPKGRKIGVQAFRHLGFLLAAPILAVIWLSFKNWIRGWSMLRPILGISLIPVMTPFLALWLVCSLMYALVPNTKVHLKGAVWAGLLASIVLEIARDGMNYYTVHVLQHSHVYGALWVFPVILIWFYISWTIILFGAEVAYYLQDPTGDAMEGRR
jgi:membrane protein